MLKKIVLIDDHRLFLDGMSALLNKQDDIELMLSTTSIEKALNFIEKNPPDLVITDISMPEMSGIELIALLKSKYPDIKIMVLSMFASVQSYEDIDAYLLKETDEEELIKAINMVVDDNEKYLKINEDKEENIQLIENKTLLTSREKEIIKLIIKEHTTTEIAQKLNISVNTVYAHRRNIFFKLEVGNIAGLTKKAIQLGII